MKNWRSDGRGGGKDAKRTYRSTTHYILSGLVPYTEANIKLAFKPSAFFNDLERLDQEKRRAGTLRVSYYRAVKQGLVCVDDVGMPQLTKAGLQQLRRYEPRKLKGAASVLVVFDIPEEERRLRSRLRALLRELRFTQIQQSVWRSEYDVVDYLVEGLRQDGLSEYVEVHESIRIN